MKYRRVRLSGDFEIIEPRPKRPAKPERTKAKPGPLERKHKTSRP